MFTDLIAASLVLLVLAAWVGAEVF